MTSDFPRILLSALVVGAAALVSTAAEPAAARPDQNRFTRTVLLEGLNEPMMVQFDAEGRVYWTERQNGGVMRLDEKTGKVESLGTIPNSNGSETGIMGFLLARDFATSRHIYVYYAPPVQSPREVRLSRFTLGANDQVNLASEIVMMRWGWDPATHMGGGMTWDAQGNLYLSTGDDTGAGQYSSGLGGTGLDSSRTAGNSNDYRGKILRIHPEPNGSYTIPPGNLFPAGTAQTKPEIYTMGNRNPWRLSIDSATGYLHWGEVGPDGGVDSPQGDPRGYDEFNIAKRAGNFGWPYLIGYNLGYRSYDYNSNQYGPPMQPERLVNLSPRNTGIRELPPAVPAVLAYPYAISDEFPILNGGGRMAIGGPVFRRADFPASAPRRFPDYFEGKWIIGDFVRNWIMVATLNAERTRVVEIERMVPEESFSSLMDLAFGPNGDLYVVEYGTQWSSNNADARLSKIVYNGGNRAPKVVASADRTAGATPLAVALSSKGTVDHDGDRLTYQWTVSAPAAAGGDRTFTEAEPRLTIDRPGIYTVSLTVRDAAGLSGSASFPITAGNEPPQVKLEFTQGNRTFFIPDQSIAYRAVVTDREDGTVPADNVFVTAEYIPSGITGQQMAAVKGAFRPTESFRHVSALALMGTTDCRVCHQVDARSVGPSFTDISRRYKDQPGALELLTQKVITGGSGSWGQVPMAAHPNLTQAEATSLVEYILSTADTNSAPQRLPLQGTFVTSVPAAAAPVSRLGGGGTAGVLQAQQAAIGEFNAAVAPHIVAITEARNALTTASFASPADPADLRAKAQALAAAELAAATARASAFAGIQASHTRLTAQQQSQLVQAAAAGTAVAVGGGRGGRGAAPAGAFVLRASYQDKGANGVAPILNGDIVLLRSQVLTPQSADIRSAGISFTASRDPGFFIVDSGAHIGFRNIDLTGIGRIEITAVTQFYQWPTMQGATVEFRQDSPTGRLLGSVPIYPAAAGAGRGAAAAGARGVDLPAGSGGIHDIYFVFVNPDAKPGNQLLLVNNVAFRPPVPAAAP